MNNANRYMPTAKTSNDFMQIIPQTARGLLQNASFAAVLFLRFGVVFCCIQGAKESFFVYLEHGKAGREDPRGLTVEFRIGLSVTQLFSQNNGFLTFFFAVSSTVS